MGEPENVDQQMEDPPIVLIDSMEITENVYDDGKNRWSALKLIEHSKKYKAFEVPTACFDLGQRPWGRDMNMYRFLYHVKRMLNADLKYPIILDDEGTIADGWHRIAKAVHLEEKNIKAIRLESMPDPDGPTELT